MVIVKRNDTTEFFHHGDTDEKWNLESGSSGLRSDATPRQVKLEVEIVRGRTHGAHGLKPEP